jgi:hypothetical protein
MLTMAATALPAAAAGWAFLYWLLGGGFVGAIIIFFILKMLGK